MGDARNNLSNSRFSSSKNPSESWAGFGQKTNRDSSAQEMPTITSIDERILDK